MCSSRVAHDPSVADGHFRTKCESADAPPPHKNGEEKARAFASAFATNELLALPGQGPEPLFLLGDAPRRQLFVRGAGRRRGHLREVAEIVPDDGDALIELRNRR